MSRTDKKILFVEDDPVVLTLYRNRLQREGFEVLFAEDGEVALDVLSRVRPDLVVLDLMLPKVNGAEVLRHMGAPPPGDDSVGEGGLPSICDMSRLMCCLRRSRPATRRSGRSMNGESES